MLVSHPCWLQSMSLQPLETCIISASLSRYPLGLATEGMGSSLDCC